MKSAWMWLALVAGLLGPATVLVGCGDDDDDATADGDADSDSDSDSDGDGDGDADVDCAAACDHIESCNFPDFNPVSCVATCQCNSLGVARPELVPQIVECTMTTECVEDYASQCVAALEYEPTADAAAFVTACTARVTEVCPDEAANYDCSIFGVITDEAAAAFTPCLEEATCADALNCVSTAALGICGG